MKGFKMLSGMYAIHGNGMQYELGKEYYMDGAPDVCESGFHFCKRIEDCFCLMKMLGKKYKIGDI